MTDYIKKYYKFILIFIILLIITILGFISMYFYNKNLNEEKKNNKEQVVVKKEKKETLKEKIKYFFVDIKGAVNNPGVYKLEENSRVIDVINNAGGLKPEADTSILNLSKKIEDEMIIIVYTNDELKEYKEKLKQISEINSDLYDNIICPDSSNKACINNSKKDNKSNNNEDSKEENQIISINTATKEELMTISGIGENKANEIIKYREENGEFKTIEEITNVSGIGNSLFEKIKDYITV